MTERKTSSTNYRNQSFLEEKCSLNELLDLVSKRWFSDVLFCIEEGANRFKLIKDDLKYISDTILSDRLKLLERYSLISRMDFDEILEAWIPLTYTLNALNRGMGLSDLYPFVLSVDAVEKLHFVHEVIDHAKMQGDENVELLVGANASSQ